MRVSGGNTTPGQYMLLELENDDDDDDDDDDNDDVAYEAWDSAEQTLGASKC
jgi:hypothetical protein